MQYVLYHGPSCPDGYGAAWAAYQKFSDEATYIPVSYGQKPPEMSGQSDVLIVDFSYPRDVLLGLKDAGHHVTVLDHHASAQRDLEGLDFCEFDMNRSGAVMTWQHLHPDIPEPRLLLWIQDRDLWRFALPYSRQISAWLYSHPFDFAVWSLLRNCLESDECLDIAVGEGEALLRLQDKYVEQMCHHVHLSCIGGYAVPVANATVLFSEVGEKLHELYPEAAFAGYFSVRSDGLIQWGLRRRTGDVDVSAVAKQYGGGGHPSAAGFVAPRSAITLHEWR